MPLFLQNTQTLMLNVKDYGATGNGIRDDTAAIQAAINANASSAVIFFPAGNYIISSSLIIDRNQVALVAEGDTFTTQITIAGTADPSYALIIGNTANVLNCIVSGLTFKGRISASSTGGGILLRGSQCSLKQVRVLQFGGTGVNIIGFSGGGIADIFLDDIYLTQNGMNTTTPGDNLVIDGTATDCEYHRVISGGNSAKNTTRYGFNNAGNSQKFIDSHAYFCASDGYHQSGGSGTEIIGGEYETNVGNNVSIANTSNFVVSGISTFGTTTAKDIAINTIDFGTITGNVFNSPTSGNGLDIISSTRMAVADNIIGSPTGFGINIGSGCNRINVHDNVVNSSTTGISVTGQYCNIHHNEVSLGNITEQSGADFNMIHQNVLFTGGKTITLVGTHSTAFKNSGYNPVGQVTAPTFPATTVAATNATGVDVTAFIANGTAAITVIQVAGASGTYVTTGYQIGVSGFGTVRIPALGSVKFTYASGAPTWTWMGE